MKPLNATQAYGPNLRYIVRWRRRDPRGSWYNETVKASRHVVWNTPIYVPYEIKVQAENDFGRAPEPDTYIGYSGEDCEYLPSQRCQCFRAGALPSSVSWRLHLGRVHSTASIGTKTQFWAWEERGLAIGFCPGSCLHDPGHSASPMLSGTPREQFGFGRWSHFP